MTILIYNCEYTNEDINEIGADAIERLANIAYPDRLANHAKQVELEKEDELCDFELEDLNDGLEFSEHDFDGLI